MQSGECCTWWGFLFPPVKDDLFLSLTTQTSLPCHGTRCVLKGVGVTAGHGSWDDLWSSVTVIIVAKICTNHLLPRTWLLPKPKCVKVECPADFPWHLNPDQCFEVGCLVQAWCISTSLCLQTITSVLGGPNLCLSGKTFGRFERRGKGLLSVSGAVEERGM